MMRYSNEGWFRQQFGFLRRQFLQEGDLPFTEILSDETIAPALDAIEEVWYDRIYTPLVTLWVFLGQVMSEDHSCRSAVARLLSHRISQGHSPCSSRTGAYCQSRKRLPEKFFSCVARLVGKTLDDQADSNWLWNGRRVYMFDGTTVTMPDTPANQDAYPQLYNQKPGLGFPIARVCTIMSLACGAVVDLGICRYAGKGQGELSELRRLWKIFCAGDVLLADRLMCSWTEMVQLKERGVDSVTQLNRRKVDFRRGKRLGKGDHVVKWPKPQRRPKSVDLQTYKSLPDYMEVRELRVRLAQKGFRTKEIIVVTTIIDPEAATKEDLASLYRSRWSQELDLRDIKITLGMDFLRCKTPELVRKEIWTHILAYNLIRTVMAQAAHRHEIRPRKISFKGTLQTLEAFQPLLDFQGHRALIRQEFYNQLLDALASHRVADRPDRFEPRKRKRRPKKADIMMKPRAELKRLMRKGVTKI